jgi:exopolyphosphatase/guanosine-5'-triphosphate,3'-diphosphate pyrophosphatase
LELERADGGFVHSVPFGTVRILNQYPELREPMGPKTLERYRKQIYADLHDALAGCRAGKVAVGTGGNLDALARIIPTDSGLVPAIDVSSLREAMGRVAPLSLEERMKFYGLREDRADLVVPAMLVIESLVKHFRLGAVQVPGSGMREAILYEQLKGEGWACDVHAIAMRFGLTPARFERRALIARGLFTALYPLHRLYPQAQRILELALALADSGQLIGHERGLEHTLYIAEHLEDSELDAEGQALLGYILASQSEEFKRRYGRRLRAAQRRAGDALGILYQIALTLTDLGVRKPPKLGLTTQPIGVHVGQSWEGVAPLFEILGEQLGCVFEQAA